MIITHNTGAPGVIFSKLPKGFILAGRYFFVDVPVHRAYARASCHVSQLGHGRNTMLRHEQPPTKNGITKNTLSPATNDGGWPSLWRRAHSPPDVTGLKAN